MHRGLSIYKTKYCETTSRALSLHKIESSSTLLLKNCN